MAANPKSKEIQVQKPAQSLQAFQRSLGQGEEVGAGLLKPVLLAAGLLLAGVLGFFGWQAWRSSALERHENAMAEVVQAVFGDGLAPVAPSEIEKRMREQLPLLEGLVKRAPGPARSVAEGTLASWRLQLEGQGGLEATAGDPWSRLRLAHRQVALGQAQEADQTLRELRAEAQPDEPWASLYWTLLMDLHRLKGDRSEALKDFADYKNRYKERADPVVERMLASI